MIRLQFWPMATSPASDSATAFKGGLNTALILLMIACAAFIVALCARRWLAALRANLPDRIPAVVTAPVPA